MPRSPRSNPLGEAAVSLGGKEEGSDVVTVMVVLMARKDWFESKQARAATTKSIPFLATGGRHGYTTTLGKLHEGLAIDLSKLNQIRIRDGHVTVGLGVQFQDVIGPILEAGYEMPVGSCEPLRRNFGVITSATYKLTEAPNGGRVFTADLMYGASQMTKYFDALKGLEDTMPAELAINIAITWDATANERPQVGCPRSSGPVLCYQCRSHLTSVVPYNEVPSVILFGMITALTAPGGIYGIYSPNLARFDIGSFNSAYKTFDAFYYKAYPNGRSSADVLESFSNQAVAAVPTDATAYPWKASKGNLC